MPKAQFQLNDLEINEGSLVDKGDNPEAHVALFKMRADEDAVETAKDADQPDSKPGFFARIKAWVTKGGPEPRMTGDIVDSDEFEFGMMKLRLAFQDSISSILENAPATQVGAMLQDTVGQFSTRANSLAFDIGKVDKPASQELSGIVSRLVASVATEPTVGKVAEPNPISAMKRADFAKALDDLANFEIPKAQPPQEATVSTKNQNALSFDDVLKNLPEDQQATINAHLDTLKAADTTEADAAAKADEAAKAAPVNAEIATLRAQVAKLEDDKITDQMIAKAKDINLAGSDVSELAGILKGAFGRSTAEGEAIEKTFRAAAAQVSKADVLMKSIGSTGGAAPEAGSAEGKLEVAAKEIQKANPKLSNAEAYDQAMDQNPEIAAEAVGH